jgi:hypothetical protein
VSANLVGSLGVAPSDDSGAQTSDLYHWQAEMAAAEGILMVHQLGVGREDSELHAIICELHEDWIVKSPEGETLVSAKHLEADNGQWTTLRQLCNAGGLAHLFESWLKNQGLPGAKLVTNARIAGSEGNALVDALRIAHTPEGARSAEDKAKLATCCESVAREFMQVLDDKLPIDWRPLPAQKKSQFVVRPGLVDSVSTFLSRLTIDDQRPPRHLVASAAARLWIEPLLAAWGKLEGADIQAAWDAVLKIFETRMRVRGATQSSAAKVTTSPVASRDLRLAQRLVTAADIALAIRIAIETPSGFLTPRPLPRLSILGTKMTVGGCADTSIDRAEALHTAYKSFARERRLDAPGAIEDIDKLERRVHRLADHATQSIDTSGHQWGARLWAEIDRQLENEESKEIQPLDLDTALGAICDLTSRCKVWFSPRFDVEEAMKSAVLLHTQGDDS